VVFEKLFAAMLGDDQRVISKQPGSGSAEQAQRGRVLPGRIPRRIEKNQIECNRAPCIASRLHLAQSSSHCGGVNVKSRRQPQPFQIAAQNLQRRRSLFDEVYTRCAAAERLHPHSARAGIQIQKGRALNPRREHIEEGFA